MSERTIALISLLSDGSFHSGESLGEQLGVSRAAIWKLMQGIKAMGLEVYAVTGKGYRLSQPLERLEAEKILAQLEPESRTLLTRLELKQVVDSTNAYLVRSAQSGCPGGVACFAEYQRSGRGRRGRQWASPYGQNIYLSLLWRFQEGAGRLGGLSLAVAVALMRALTECGLRDAGLKWPNDILIDNRKIAGILLEVAGESNGPCYGVIGLGINFEMQAVASDSIGQPWTDLRSHGVQASRNAVAGRILHHLLLAIPEYLEQGLDAFREEWERWDLMKDLAVVIHLGEERRYGVARGIDERGLLLVEDEHGLRQYSSGEVSLRAVTR